MNIKPISTLLKRKEDNHFLIYMLKNIFIKWAKIKIFKPGCFKEIKLHCSISKKQIKNLEKRSTIQKYF